MVIAAAIRSRFDCIDPVVDSFHEISAKGPARVGQNARQVSSQPTCERANGPIPLLVARSYQPCQNLSAWSGCR